MGDTTENIRKLMVAAINIAPMDREKLEGAYGKDDVWDTEELQETFEVVGFAAPFCMVTKKETGEKGAVMFQHMPRFYFGFKPV